MTSTLETQTSVQDGVALMTVTGRIDHETAESFQADLMVGIENGKPTKGCLVLDFSAVNYISSVGLRALMLAAKASKVDNGTLAVAAYNSEVGEIFQIARFGMVVKLFDDLDDALQAVSAVTSDG